MHERLRIITEENSRSDRGYSINLNSGLESRSNHFEARTVPTSPHGHSLLMTKDAPPLPFPFFFGYIKKTTAIYLIKEDLGFEIPFHP